MAAIAIITGIASLLATEPVKGLFRDIPGVIGDRKQRLKLGEILARQGENKVRYRRDVLKSKLDALKSLEGEQFEMSAAFALELVVSWLAEAESEFDSIGDCLAGKDDDIPS